jgi:hypothetical protein
MSTYHLKTSDAADSLIRNVQHVNLETLTMHDNATLGPVSADLLHMVRRVAVLAERLDLQAG